MRFLVLTSCLSPCLSLCLSRYLLRSSVCHSLFFLSFCSLFPFPRFFLSFPLPSSLGLVFIQLRTRSPIVQQTLGETALGSSAQPQASLSHVPRLVPCPLCWALGRLACHRNPWAICTTANLKPSAGAWVPGAVLPDPGDPPNRGHRPSGRP